MAQAVAFPGLKQGPKRCNDWIHYLPGILVEAGGSVSGSSSAFGAFHEDKSQHPYARNLPEQGFITSQALHLCHTLWAQRPATWHGSALYRTWIPEAKCIGHHLRGWATTLTLKSQEHFVEVTKGSWMLNSQERFTQSVAIRNNCIWRSASWVWGELVMLDFF